MLSILDIEGAGDGAVAQLLEYQIRAAEISQCRTPIYQRAAILTPPMKPPRFHQVSA